MVREEEIDEWNRCAVTKMKSHAYFRALAAQAAPTNDALRPVRVRLLFLDEMGAYVQRQRGFASCWYLIPRTAKLVGDMLRDIMEEFELLERCPHGVELLLEGSHVLANQDIDVIRDHDTLAVQCAAEPESGATTTTLSTSSSHKTNDQTARSKRKHAQAALPEKRTYASSSSSDCSTCRDSDDESDDKRKRMKLDEAVATRRKRRSNLSSRGKEQNKATAVESNSQGALRTSTSRIDSNNGSDSDSSDSDSSIDVSNTKQRDALRGAMKETVKTMEKSKPAETTSSTDSSSSSSSSGSSSSSDDSSDESDDDKTAQVQARGKEVAAAARTRRRRRQRRRPKPTDQAPESSTVAPKASTGVISKPTGERQVSMQPPHATPAREVRPLRIRGVPPTQDQSGTNHVRFDRPQQPQQRSTPASASSAKDLQKYGPRPAPPQENQPSASARSEREQRARSDNAQSKKPSKEMWKRPYEIVASIHNTPSVTDHGYVNPSLDAMVSKFPAKPDNASLLPVPSGLQVDDVIAYKTLTLCMETWHPVVSEWLCGKVVAVDNQAVTLQPLEWILPNYSAIPLGWKSCSEDSEAVQVLRVELNELRYLEGPTKAHLEKA